MTRFEERILTVAAAISRGAQRDEFIPADLMPEIPEIDSTSLGPLLRRMAQQGFIVPIEDATAWRMTGHGWEETARSNRPTTV